MVLFKDGMKINLSYKSSWKDYMYYILSFIFMVCFWTGIPLGLMIGRQLFGLMGVWVIYMIYSCCTDSCKYIQNLVELP